MNQPWSFITFNVSNATRGEWLAVWIYLFENKIIETDTRSPIFARSVGCGFNELIVTTDYTEDPKLITRGQSMCYPNDQLGFQKYISTTDALMIKAGTYDNLSKIIDACSFQNRLITKQEYKNGKILSTLAQ